MTKRIATAKVKTAKVRATRAAKRQVVVNPSPSVETGGATAEVEAENASGVAVNLVNPPPKVTIPSPPKGYVAPPVSAYRSPQPKTAMLMMVPGVVSELKSFADYTVTFGATAPPAADVAKALTTAAAWSAVLHSTNAWLGYVRPSEGLAWKVLQPVLDQLKGAFALAVAANPALGTQYPSLTGFLGIRNQVSARAAVTRKRNEANTTALKAATASNAAATASVTAAPPPAATSTPAANGTNASVLVMAKG